MSRSAYPLKLPNSIKNAARRLVLRPSTVIVLVSVISVVALESWMRFRHGSHHSAIEHLFQATSTFSQYPITNTWHLMAEHHKFIKAMLPALIGFGGLVWSNTRIAARAANIRKLELKLKTIETQIEKLYGPLLAECIEADSMFRRVELAMETRGNKEHRHYDLRSIKSSDLKDADTAWESDHTHSISHCRLFAKMLVRVFLPLNERRMKIIQGHLHLLGPAPPTSIYLFMTHSAQLRSIIEVKRQIDLDFSAEPIRGKRHRYNDPYILTPYPSMMTGEIVAKVALLKALQREYQYRLAGDDRTEEEVFCREQYYLIVDKYLREKLAWHTDVSYKVFTNRPDNHKAFYPPVFPLVWGPYSAIELFELRSWLISREISVRRMPGLKAECELFRAMLAAEVAKINRNGDPDIEAVKAPPYEEGDIVRRPFSDRVAQMFDELDDPGSKMNHPWDKNFQWEYLQEAYGNLTLQEFIACGYKLADKGERNLPKAQDIAYDRSKYNKMRDD